MGVQGLWELLAPVGRRVSVETLSGKKLAIDASIWMIQFIKAMRDERGEMVRNAHILGFFRRICKLLFLRAKPVFVFDGGTPALKRRTVAARRRHRENASAKIRKTAEKLLLNHLKSKRLEELAEEIKTSKSGVKGDLNGKQVASANDDSMVFEKASSSAQSYKGFQNQESLDEMLAASIAAEEEGKLAGIEPVQIDDCKYDEEGEEDEDEQMIFPVNSGNIDPAVLASLPPSMQLDLLDQMREKLMAENRQKYQKIKKVPAKFSELQIHSYLKTVAFRREINEVQKCASGRGVGGLQTSRIASEANREYIFSSSFTGDRQKLTPTAAEKNGSTVNHEMRMTTASDASKRKLFISPSKPSVDTSSDIRESTPDVETYLDDRGRVRVSRVRGLGIKMTRDLQRNLDMMNEYDKVLLKKDFNDSPELISDSTTSNFPIDSSQTNVTPNISLVNEENSHLTSTMTIPEKKAAIEISFSEAESKSNTMVDSFFMNLVSENAPEELYSESISLDKNMDDFESDCIWEDGVVGEQSSSLKSNDDNIKNKGCQEDDVVWEEGASLISHSMESVEAVSRGLLEEEADLKEAIRRSIEDLQSKQPSSAITVGKSTRIIIEDQNPLISVKDDLSNDVSVQSAQLQSASSLLEREYSNKRNTHLFMSSANEHLYTSTIPGHRSDGESTLKDDKNNLAVCCSVGVSHDIQSMEHCENQLLQKNICNVASDLMNKELNLGETDDHDLDSYTKFDFEPNCRSLDTACEDILNNSVTILSNHTSKINSSISSSSGETLSAGLSEVRLTEGMPDCIDMQELAENDTYEEFGERFRDKAPIQEESNTVASEADLYNEISVLKQERAYLGSEQRKLERNAESVSSEMFAECQELLQMFGLPYIIAPMEAEAQCAYMEITNLVDGIVTDDSDVFLFGARNVFKNIFDDRKYVETYFMKDIENELGLSRDKLIHIALLLGSDYTEGVSGIGIVNAIEVINAFPEKDGLLKFKNWVESPDPSIFGLQGPQHGGNLRKKSSNTKRNVAGGVNNNIGHSTSQENGLGGDQSSDSVIPDTDEKEVFMEKHRNVSKNWHFPPSFPSESVVSAYISPQIDDSTEPFAWGKPDLPLLRKMCWEKFGWPNQKADELLVPVLKEYNKHETQLRMEAFYSFNERFAKIRSQRIKKAVKSIAGVSSSVLTDSTDGGSTSKKRRGNTLHDKQLQSKDDTEKAFDPERKSVKRSRKATKSQSPPHVSAESSKQDGGVDNSRQIIDTKGTGRGRGRVRGGKHVNKKFTESTSVDENSTQSSTMTIESLPEMRRSARRRKHVNYGEDSSEINDTDSINQAMPQDYIHSGGGFCLEENEIQDEELRPVTIPLKHSFELSENGEGDSSKGCDEKVEKDLHVVEELGREEDAGDDRVKCFLSAMPSLKRKRRKG